MTKIVNRICNWREYNRSLIERGNLKIWVSEEVLLKWQQKENDESAHGNQKYPDEVINCCLVVRQLFGLTLRATQGFMLSITALMRLDVKTPDYTTLSRRGAQLKINLGVKKSTEPRHILVDSTGVQVIGEGEWKKFNHGESRHQLWRKLHIAMDAKTHEVLSAMMTESVRLDGNYLPKLIEKIEGPIGQITGDGAYDKKNCYRIAYERGAKPVFPPQHNAGIQRNKKKKDPALLARDKTISFINKGNNPRKRRRLWKKKNNYHRRSLVETMMSRLKSIFGDQMSSRNWGNQFVDLHIRCQIINRMNRIGLPKRMASV